MTPQSNNQTQVNFKLDEDFIEKIDLAAMKERCSRSELMRSAIREKVERVLGLAPGSLKEVAAAPSRLGKGGRPTHRTEPVNPALNDSASAMPPKNAGIAQKVSYLRKKKTKP